MFHNVTIADNRQSDAFVVRLCNWKKKTRKNRIFFAFR